MHTSDSISAANWAQASLLLRCMDKIIEKQNSFDILSGSIQTSKPDLLVEINSDVNQAITEVSNVLFSVFTKSEDYSVVERMIPLKKATIDARGVILGLRGDLMLKHPELCDSSGLLEQSLNSLEQATAASETHPRDLHLSRSTLDAQQPPRSEISSGISIDPSLPCSMEPPAVVSILTKSTTASRPSAAKRMSRPKVGGEAKRQQKSLSTNSNTANSQASIPTTSRPPPISRSTARRGIGTSCFSCSARKVKCDRRKPSCGNCSKRREVCQPSVSYLRRPRFGQRSSSCPR